MRLGVVFAQSEIGSDPAAIHDYAQAERAGHARLLVFDHVLGAKLERFDMLGRQPPYTDESPFHEVFVLFGYLGARTRRLELVTGIVILPQRQTARWRSRPRSCPAAGWPRRRHRLEPCRVHPSTCATSYPGVDGRNGEWPRCPTAGSPNFSPVTRRATPRGVLMLNMLCVGLGHVRGREPAGP